LTRLEDERRAFVAAPDREAYLRANSHLPGPRSNLELLSAAAEEVDLDWAAPWAAAPAGDDPTDVFVISVALVALGRFLAGGRDSVLPTLRLRATHAEWRIREAVAIALQRVGDADLPRLTRIALEWAAGDPLVQRAAVAAVAEPRLLRDGQLVPAALEILDAATRSVADAASPSDPDVRVLRQALGYAWAGSDNREVAWIVRENLKKDRLRRLGLPPLAT
jgi:hypothetical protein